MKSGDMVYCKVGSVDCFEQVIPVEAYTDVIQKCKIRDDRDVFPNHILPLESVKDMLNVVHRFE
jgi:hypothetical protein